MVGPAIRKRRQDQLRELIAQAGAARATIDATVTRARAEIRDPYGIRTTIADHPFVTAGVATGVGVAAARIVAGRVSAHPDAPTRIEYWAGKLLDGGLAAVRPLCIAWLQRWLAELAPTATPTSSTTAAAPL